MHEARIAGVDIGSQTIKLIRGLLDQHGHMQIVGATQVPSQGIRRGGIVNMDEVANCLSLGLERLAHVAGDRPKTAYLTVTGAHVASLNHRGAVAITPSDRDIELDDVKRVLDIAGAIPLEPERQIIAVMPRTYMIDGQDGINNPVGMAGHRLEVEAHIVTGAVAAYRNLLRCAQRARLEVEDFVLSALAAGEAVLGPTEREQGTVLIDLGAETADVAVYADGGVWRTFMVPLGGRAVTDDIAFGLRLPLAVAEELKRQYGTALPARIPPAEMIDLDPFLPNSNELIARRTLAGIIAPRVEEIFGLIGDELRRSGRERLLAGGVVVTGGGAELAGVAELAAEVFDAPVRIGLPHSLYGATAQINSPSFAAAVGLLRWHEQMAQSDGPDGALEWVRRLVGRLFNRKGAAR